MISSTKLIKMARKWQKLARIASSRTTWGMDADTCNTPTVDKGHFVVYTADRRRFVIPLVYLNNSNIRELLKIAEEEYALNHSQNQDIMISPKKIIKMARKWQRMAAIRRKRISLPAGTNKDVDTGSSCSSSSVAYKGHFVVYTADRRRFLFPLAYLNNYIFKEMLKMSEEEFGLPSDGPITLPCDAAFMDYVVSLVQSRPTEDIQKALLMSIATSRCSLPCSLQQLQTSQQLLVCGF
ncbi:hypothetical protein F0562_020950 [Nyssa sinensis]|uniref:Auxin-responsive protein n=1 Tax=Nyssa sinensis TaxID=561372 RepID=A0A5J5BTZ2_9ASTE|nr:hypothetical protein F0562_020950 [Nyssa sinensis]